MSSTTTPHRTLDARGKRYPRPILEAKKELDLMASGEILEILTTDRNSKPDLPIWAAKVGAAILQTGEAEGVFRLVIRKA